MRMRKIFDSSTFLCLSDKDSITTAVSLPSRSEIDEKYKWNLKDIYESEDQWDKDFNWVQDNIGNYKNFVGKLGNSANDLLNCLKFDDEMGIKLQRLYLYSMLAKDSDMRVTKYQAMNDRIKSLYAQISTENSFIRPEILSISEDKISQFLNSGNELKVYKHYIEDILRTKPHTLPPDQERILALSSETTQVAYNTFSMFTNADMKFPVVEDDEGKLVEVSHGRYYAAMYSKDRKFRERAYKNYYKPYKEYVNTFSSLFSGNLKSYIFHAKARKYNSAREAALDNNNIPVSVYDNLVESTNSNLKPLHRWAELKKKLLNIDELHPYDTYVTLFSMKEKKYSYEEAKKIIYEALMPMGDEYLNTLHTAFDKRWIDVFETQAKRSGAYSSGTTYGIHPYVLLNWNNLLNDVFTLAHEMGHNMHSYYTGLSQPYPYANYTIFIAEVASTFNEALLLSYLIKNSGSKEDKLYLLEKYLNNITTTFYRQVMFAEFETNAYNLSEKGEALTHEVLCKMFGDLYKKYWGPAMVIDEEESYTWARVPHFYYNFYVYQYATGFAASETLSNKVLADGKTATNKYLNLLKSGSSDYSINLLRLAGVDMDSPEPVIATTQRMNQLLDELEGIINS
jgi:oligoendopeptidase F